LGHHEGVAKIISGAASAPLDTGNATLGVSRRHKVHWQNWGVEHEFGGSVSGLVRSNAVVAVDVNVEDGPMALLELGNIAKFLVTVARGLRGDRAPRESMPCLHTAQAVGDHDRDRIHRSGEVVLKGGEFGFVGMALKGICVDVQLAPKHRAAKSLRSDGQAHPADASGTRFLVDVLGAVGSDEV
jgi:hypothetical protein